MSIGVATQASGYRLMDAKWWMVNVRHGGAMEDEEPQTYTNVQSGRPGRTERAVRLPAAIISSPQAGTGFVFHVVAHNTPMIDFRHTEARKRGPLWTRPMGLTVNA